MILPSGPYLGTVTTPRLSWLNRIWTGKVFTGTTVKNRICGCLLIEGQVRQEAKSVSIIYPGGLTDSLVPGDAFGHTWFGVMDLYGHVVAFTLERQR